jgi:hypothetical protein
MECRACTISRPPARSTLHGPVRTYTQFMSSGLIDAIAYHGADPGSDPLWADSGAHDNGEYAFWSGRACGMACLQMILNHLQLPVPGLVPLCLDAFDAGCYIRRADGGLDGLLYEPFTRFVRKRFGLHASVEVELGRDRLSSLLHDGALVMASVHREIRRPDRPSPGRGGHLVLVIGCGDGQLHIRNPSGHIDGARSAVLPWDRFEPFFAMRGVAVFPAQPAVSADAAG